MKTTIIPQKVIALLRVSAEENVTVKSAILQRQQDVINRAVQANKLDVVSTVTLIDVSRNNVFLSPEFQSMLRAVEAHEVDGVVCAHQENFIRADNLASLAALDVLMRAKAKLYTSSHVHDFSTDTGIFQAHISVIVGGHELRTIKERMQGAKEEKRKAGGCPSSTITLPRGVRYDHQAKSWSYTEEVAPIKEAFRLIDEDCITSISEVARIVGIARSTLSKLLRNPIYIGWRVYQQKRSASTRTREEPIRVKVINEPAVWPERFARVQSLLDQKRINNNAPKNSEPNNN